MHSFPRLGSIVPSALFVFLLSCLSLAGMAQGVPSGDVTIAASATWPSGTYTLNSLTVNGGATLTIGGGSTVTVSGAIVVTANSAIVLQAANNTAQVNGQWVGVGSTIQAGSVEVDQGSSINADGQGYSGGYPEPGNGPGGGAGGTTTGGSYGGVGALNAANTTYGSILQPVDLGSSASGFCAYGGCHWAGSGGGAVRLVVIGTLTNNGTISANGAGGESGGAGGSVWVTTGTLAGSGIFAANGGSGNNGGGGGRVAVYYAANASFSGFDSSPAAGGVTGGGAGTVLFEDTSKQGGDLYIYEPFVFPANTVATFGSITVGNGTTLAIGGGSNLTVNALTVTGNSSVILQSLNNTAQVGGQWVGVGVTINAGSVEVDAGSSINADGQGYAGGYPEPGNGPGGGGAGGSWGGSYGGAGYNAGGTTYGSQFQPVDLGSSGSGYCNYGACHWAGSGGGAIRLVVTGILTNNGAISADGTGGESAGAGGSVWVTTGTLAGSGLFTANGGSGSGAGGGGGRVAVYYSTSNGFTGFTASTAAGGSSSPIAGGAGTVLFEDTSKQGGDLYIYQPFTISQDAVATYDAITVGNGTTLTIGGGSNLTLNAITVTGASNVVVQSANNAAQVNGQWVGAGVTINAASVQVDQGSSINADGQGYSGGAITPGRGPGGGSGTRRYRHIHFPARSRFVEVEVCRRAATN